ncbi:MAG: AMP-binding protein [Eubacteriales bacterium]|nr:AMP-binding protein [Eubacteriales bacterium]
MRLPDMKINPELEKLYKERGQWTDDTLLTRFEQTVEKFGDREFVVDDLGRRYTYREMDEYSDQVAAVLYDYGVREGSMVTYQITPRTEFVAVMLACFKLGAVSAPLGMYFEEKGLHEILSLLGSNLHISVAKYRGRDRGGMIEEAVAGILNKRRIILIGESKVSPEFVCLEDLLLVKRDVPPRPKGTGTDLSTILCTSGTTSMSKAVMLTNDNIIFSEDGFNKELGLTEEDIMFMPAPLNHATGYHHGIISPMLRGGKLILQERFCCVEAIELMNKEKVTYSMGATPFIYDLVATLDRTGMSLPYLRFYICGGAPVPEFLVKRAFENHQILVCECYGATESVPHVYVRPEEALEVHGKHSGKAMGGIEVRIVDAQHNEVPRGEVGEEASRGPSIFVGYLHNKEATDKALDDDGWYYSGDLCTMDEEGNIKVVGRIKDVIIRGGENLNANLIDANLDGCPGVADHAVIGRPEDRLGERICAFLVCEPGCHPTKEDVTEYLKQKKVHKRFWPEYIEYIDKIPRTDSGKTQKFKLDKVLRERMGISHEKALVSYCPD